MRQAFLLAILFVWAVSVVEPVAAARLYAAALDDSRWSSKPGADACHLEHPVPMFGRAVLSQTPDGSLALNVYALRPPLTDGAAVLLSRNPTWKPAEETRIEATRMYSDGPLLRFSDHTTRRILSELEAGRLPVVRFSEWPGVETEVELAISPVGFHEGYRRHLACVAALPPPAMTSEDLLVRMGYSAAPSPADVQRATRDAPPPVRHFPLDPMM